MKRYIPTIITGIASITLCSSMSFAMASNTQSSSTDKDFYGIDLYESTTSNDSTQCYLSETTPMREERQTITIDLLKTIKNADLTPTEYLKLHEQLGLLLNKIPCTNQKAQSIVRNLYRYGTRARADTYIPFVYSKENNRHSAKIDTLGIELLFPNYPQSITGHSKVTRPAGTFHVFRGKHEGESSTVDVGVFEDPTEQARLREITTFERKEIKTFLSGGIALKDKTIVFAGLPEGDDIYTINLISHNQKNIKQIITQTYGSDLTSSYCTAKEIDKFHFLEQSGGGVWPEQEEFDRACNKRYGAIRDFNHPSYHIALPNALIGHAWDPIKHYLMVRAIPKK